jgi:A/G-specific adenine glycosylase
VVDAPRSEALLAWYGRHQREVAWRRTTDPWAILVSEVMAQQTQVPRVIPKWQAFMERYPTPADCATAPRAEVLSLWSGLGYNSRAIRLHAAAARIAEQGWPTTPEGLQALPGVGPYTAAAVACFAFGVQVPAVDTNVRRVLSRWAGQALDRRALLNFAETEIPDGLAADWNQALMDLGASICTPRDPACSICPVVASCLDPTVYTPPRPQGRFEGSRRQARGAAIRSLTAGPATATGIAKVESMAVSRVETALDLLRAEGLVERDETGMWAIV